MKQIVQKTRNAAEKSARALNTANKATKGMLFNNPLVQTIVPYANMAVAALGLADELMDNVFANSVTHPQGGGSGAVVSYNVPVQRRAPKFRNVKGNITIVHKELIGTVVSNTVTAVSPVLSDGTSMYQVNASNQSLFPWLSTIAANYDYFRFNRLTLVYVPVCSTTTQGRVMLAYDPDGSDPIIVDRSALSAYQNSSEGSAWGVQKLDCKLSHLTPWYNTSSSSNALPGLGSQGQVLNATWSGTDTNVCGEWYVLYDVTLKDPQPSTINVTRAQGIGAGSVTYKPEYNRMATIMSTATSISVLFYGTGSYMVTIFADSTACGTQSVSGPCSLSGYNRAAGAAGCTVVGFVNVTGGGYSTTGISVTGGSVYTVDTLTALGKWNVIITKFIPNLTANYVDHPTGT
jgi:hypothetical protein